MNLINIDSVDFNTVCMGLQKRCYHLETLIITKTKFSGSFSAVMDLCIQFLPNVKKLVFCNSVFSDSQSTGEFGGISKIECLYVFDCGTNSYDIPLNKPAFSKMPYLKHLKLCNSIITDSWFIDDPSFLSKLQVLHLGHTRITSRTVSAVQNHGHNIKELCLSMVLVECRSYIFNSSEFPQLQTICLGFFYDLQCVFSLLQSCQSLQTIFVNEELAANYGKYTFIAANSQKPGIIKAVNCKHFDEVMSYL